MKTLRELLTRRDAVQTELDTLTALGENDEVRTLQPDEEVRATELLTERDELDERITELTAEARRTNLIREARQLAGTARPANEITVSEPMVYGEGSPHSHALDIARRTFSVVGGTNDGGAIGRLEQWGHQVEREIANESPIGQRALRNVRESFRESGPNAPALVAEVRARGRLAAENKGEMRTGITTGGGATATASSGGAAFVSPVIFLDKYAAFREYGRPFADMLNDQELPEYGMEIYIPAVTGTAGVTAQTEGTAVAETDPTVGYRSAAVVTKAGQVIITQQLLDRAGPGFAFDKMIYDQLERKYDAVWDTYALVSALAGATAQSWTGNSNTFVWSVANAAGGFQGQVNLAAATMEELAGTVTTPNVLFLKPSRWRYIASFADGNARPLIVPNGAGPFNAGAATTNESGHTGTDGPTGYSICGIPTFKDANIPTPGSGADQAVVADTRDILSFEGAKNLRAVPQTLAGNLQVILQLYAYGAVEPLYPAAVAAISGTGMAAITYTN